MKPKFLIALTVLAAVVASAQQFSIVADTNGFGTISFTNKYFTGVSTLEGRVGRKWVSVENFFTTQRVGQVTLRLPTNYTTFRVRTLSVAPGNASTHLAAAYGNIHTLAGQPGTPVGTNLWRTNYEGAPAISVPLSNPRAAAADLAGDIYVVEQDSHAVSVIKPDGTIHTAAGTREPGLIVDDGFPIPVAIAPLNRPTGLWINGETIYVLDAGNARVIRLGTNGFLQTVFFDTNGIPHGGGLWVAPDESEILYTDGTLLKRWRPSVGVEVFATAFVDLATVARNPIGQIIAVDRGDHRLYRVRGNGSHVQLDVQAGTGFPTGPSAGKVSLVSLPGPSSIYYLPIGGYLLATDAGARVLYVDDSNNAAPLIFGKPGAHDGDGEWFRAGGRRPKISNTQSVNLTPTGDILLVEGGFVRKIDFLRHRP